MSTSALMTLRLEIAIAFGFVYFVWGSTFVAIRYSAPLLNPALLSGLRFLIASIVLIGILALRRQSLRMPSAEFAKVASLGVLMFSINTVLVNYASRTVPAGFTALVLATIPLMVAILESLLPGVRRMDAIGSTGIFTGFLGIWLLLSSNASGKLTSGSSTKACSALLVAAAAWAVGSVLAHRFTLTSPPLVLCAWQMLVGGVVNLTIGVATGGLAVANWNGSLWGAVLYLAIFGSLASYTAYLFLLRNVPVSLVSTYAYVNPVVAVVLGSTIQHEPLHGRQWVAMGVVISSVVVVLWRLNIRRGNNLQTDYATAGIAEQ